MLGRTNTNLYGGVSLNADVEQCMIADGETLIAGDFVKITPSETFELLSTFSDVINFITVTKITDEILFITYNDFASDKATTDRYIFYNLLTKEITSTGTIAMSTSTGSTIDLRYPIKVEVLGNVVIVAAGMTYYGTTSNSYSYMYIYKGILNETKDGFDDFVHFRYGYNTRMVKAPALNLIVTEFDTYYMIDAVLCYTGSYLRARCKLDLTDNTWTRPETSLIKVNASGYSKMTILTNRFDAVNNVLLKYASSGTTAYLGRVYFNLSDDTYSLVETSNTSIANATKDGAIHKFDNTFVACFSNNNVYVYNFIQDIVAYTVTIPYNTSFSSDYSYVLAGDNEKLLILRSGVVSGKGCVAALVAIWDGSTLTFGNERVISDYILDTAYAYNGGNRGCVKCGDQYVMVVQQYETHEFGVIKFKLVGTTLVTQSYPLVSSTSNYLVNGVAKDSGVGGDIIDVYIPKVEEV